jgi:hypothetical protein
VSKKNIILGQIFRDSKQDQKWIPNEHSFW